MASVISQTTKDIVNGYIRSMEVKLHVNIPRDIFPTFILFNAWEKDTFETATMDMRLSNDKSKITKKITDGFSNAFGKKCIKEGCHIWKFWIQDYDSRDSDILIGVWKSLTDDSINSQLGGPLAHSDEPFIAIQHNITYGFGLQGKVFMNTLKVLPYGMICHNGAIIEMILDLDNHSLKFIINGKDFGKACTVQQGIYRAVVYVYKQGDTVQML